MYENNKAIVHRIILFSVTLLLKPSLIASYETQSEKYILIIPLYGESQKVRQQEYLNCLEINLKNNLIEKIHIIYDTSSHDTSGLFLRKLIALSHKHQKIIINFIDRRQTYGDAFKLANTFHPNRTVIVSNADIFFDESLALLFNLDSENKIYALTRWELSRDGSAKLMRDATGFPAVYSQDVWIFKSPIPFFPGYDITMGVIACDHKISYELLKAGYDVFNPCHEVKCYHVHHSGIHNCKLESVPFSYSAYIPWCKLKDITKRTKIWATS